MTDMIDTATWELLASSSGVALCIRSTPDALPTVCVATCPDTASRLLAPGYHFTPQEVAGLEVLRRQPRSPHILTLDTPPDALRSPHAADAWVSSTWSGKGGLRHPRATDPSRRGRMCRSCGRSTDEIHIDAHHTQCDDCLIRLGARAG